MKANELQLIQQARAGDADAFCSLYERYRVRLYRYAFYRLGHSADAEDAVSECVLSAWKQITSLREGGAFQVWIFRILSACCSKLIRQQIRGREQISLDAGFSPQEETSASSAGYRNAAPSEMQAGSTGRDPALYTENPAERRLILQEALSQLTEEERNIVLLSAVGGLKSREIADLTGRTAGSVRSVLSRSLKKVRGYMK